MKISHPIGLLLLLFVTSSSAIAGNIIRNSSFEFPSQFNGTPMRDGKGEFFQIFAKKKDTRIWTELPVEGWWIVGPENRGVSIDSNVSHTFEKSLHIDGEKHPFPVVSAYDRMVPKGSVTLLAYVKCESAKGKMLLRFATGDGVDRKKVAEKSVDLPRDCDWQRLAITLKAGSPVQALAQFDIEGGQVWIDDVQVESSTKADGYNTRVAEWVNLSFTDDEKEKLPIWTEGDSAAKSLHSERMSVLDEDVEVCYFLGTWDDPKQKKLGKAKLNSLEPIDFSIADLAPNAYVITSTVSKGGKVIYDSSTDFHPERAVGGKASNGMLSSPAVIRFVIAPKRKPEAIFGVGNGMMANDDWFGGYRISNFTEARDLGIVCSRGAYNSDLLYITAAAGIPVHAMRPRLDDCPKDKKHLANPAHRRYLDIFNPDAMKEISKRAERMGKDFGTNPMIASFQMSNESPYFNHGKLCPSVHADKDFREWCKGKYGSLDKLNECWNSKLTDWEQVEQITSARFIEEEQKRPKKEGAAAIDWTASMGKFSPAVVKRMNANPGQAMDWLRWRTASTLNMYNAFRNSAKKYDDQTLYSTNLCWPNFWPQMFMQFIRDMDVTMLDVQYTSGFKRALGIPTEMIDILEMSESTAPGKPIWGIEVYVQPTFPPEFTALQNWGLLAHGMTNNLVFAWKPYSDHGRVKTAKAWEDPKAPPMWFIIDKDGTRLPHYDSNKRSAQEIARFHEQYDGLSLKRISTDIALYVSTDSSEYVTFDTGDKPWNSPWLRAREALSYSLRMNGVTTDYIDDKTLEDRPKSSNSFLNWFTGREPSRFNTVIVPPSPILSQDAAGKLADFAKSGGKVILVGISGLLDPWLKPYTNLGGESWKELGWQLNPQEVKKLIGKCQEPSFDDLLVADFSDAVKILDKDGNLLGWKRKWGDGEIIIYKEFPALYSKSPHLPKVFQTWTQRLIDANGLKVNGRYVHSEGYAEEGELGTGQPVVEIVIREKSENEKFVFCLNQGGKGSGTVEVNLGENESLKVTDALTGETVPNVKVKDGQLQLDTAFAPWEYKILRIQTN